MDQAVRKASRALMRTLVIDVNTELREGRIVDMAVTASKLLLLVTTYLAADADLLVALTTEVADDA